MSLSSQFLLPYQNPLPLSPIPFPSYGLISPFSFQFLVINDNFYFLNSSPPLFLRSTTIHESYFTLRSITILHDDIIMVKGIRNFCFECINNTDYASTVRGSQNPAIAHVGQITKYLAFDKALQEGRALTSLSIPLGYQNFATTFNTGTPDHDTRR